MAGYVSEKRLKELSKKYRACKDVSLDMCDYNHNCGSCQFCVEEDGWGTGETPAVCLVTVRKEIG